MFTHFTRPRVTNLGITKMILMEEASNALLHGDLAEARVLADVASTDDSLRRLIDTAVFAVERAADPSRHPTRGSAT